MSIFKLNLVNGRSEQLQLIFNSETNTLSNTDGSLYKLPDPNTLRVRPDLRVFDREATVYKPEETPVVRNKNGVFKDIRIFLGAKCNYECTYCYQNDVRETEPSFTMEDVDKFFEQLPSWYSGAGAGPVKTKYGEVVFKDGRDTRVQFWGGEPLVYWKIVKKFIVEFKKRYPRVTFGIVTNGSLITDEIAEFFLDNDVRINVSHDGPGQHLRGQDPLDNDETREAILKLIKNDYAAINPTLTAKNYSKVEIKNFFEQKLKRGFVHFGEADFVELFNPSDENTLDLMLNDSHQAHKFARVSFEELELYPEIFNIFSTAKIRTNKFISALYTNRHIDTVATKCGMDSEDKMVVDRNGHMLLCHHGSREGSENSCSTTSSVSDIANNEIHSANHWKTKPICGSCPVVTVCAGSCPFTTGQAHDANCRATFYDIVPTFAYALYLLTGYSLQTLEPMEDNEFSKMFPDRLDPFGTKDNDNNKVIFRRKIIALKTV